MEISPTPIQPPSRPGFFRRKDFPDGFIFGSATSAFQIEGGLREGNRGPSNWDQYAVDNKLYAPYNENSVGDYYRYKEDVKIMKEIGFDAYRFSIAWSRVMPNGRDPEPEGIDFYNSLLDELHDNGITPFVTLWHFDHPQTLEVEYKGFLSPQIVEDYKNYADFCFKTFGRKVQHWITFNEPTTFCISAYVTDSMPNYGDFPEGSSQTTPKKRSTAIARRGFTPLIRLPFRARVASAPLAGQKRSFDTLSGEQPIDVASPTDPKNVYTAGHHLLLAHAEAVNIYRTRYQALQRGEIGITLSTYWYLPYSDLPKDQEAAQRALDFELGWFLNPVMTGDYPETMKIFVTPGQLPTFDEKQSDMLRGSCDFIGQNYYSARYAIDDPSSPGGDYYADQRLITCTHRNGIPIGEPTAADWLFVYPKGILDLLLYIKNTYNTPTSPTIYITETGYPDKDDKDISLWKALFDDRRVSFYFEHLWYVRAAIGLDVKVKGFFPWSLLDNLEWGNGFSLRFGIDYVDFKDGQEKGSARYPKLSAGWFKFLLNN